MSSEWKGIDDVFEAAAAAQQAGWELDQLIEELAWSWRPRCREAAW